MDRTVTTNKLTSYLAHLLLLLALFTSAAAHSTEHITYYHNDNLGSPVAATDTQGNVVWRESYQPDGTRIQHQGDSQNKLWFTGKQEEATFGVSYFGARWYDSEMGRFLAMDPVGVSPSNPYSFNRYAYANNNPYRFVDPDGREIRVSGTASNIDAFISQVYKATGITVHYNNGILVPVGVPNDSVGSPAAARVTMAALVANETINVNTVRDDSDTDFDNFATNTYDVSDMANAFNKSNLLGAGLFTHVISERFYDAQHKDGLVADRYNAAHNHALKDEASVMGGIRDNDSYVKIDHGISLPFIYRNKDNKVVHKYNFLVTNRHTATPE